MFTTLTAQITAGLALIISLIAVVFGGQKEKWGAGYFLAGWIACIIVVRWFEPYRLPLYTLTDLLCLMGFISLCWKSQSAWPFWASACQLLSLASEILSFFEPQSKTYLYLNIYASYGILLALLLGVIFSQTKRQRLRL